MSMCLGMVALDDANIARVLADPPLIWRVIAPDDPEPYEDARRAARTPSLIGRLFGRKPAPDAPVADLDLDEDELADAELDKAWHGIHYLFTGTAWEGAPPLNLLVSGGREVGRIDVGYGPARVFVSGDVKEAHEALEGVSDETLRSRFRPDDMMKLKIYPEIWDRDPTDDDTLGYLMENVAILRRFLKEAVEHERGIVVYVS
jgi:hypothetical protein